MLSTGTPARAASGTATLERALRQRLDSLTKPPGSLGRLEEVALRLGLLQGTLAPRIESLRICVFAGTHGIAAEGVSAYPAGVTGQMVQNFLQGGAAICVLARSLRASLHIVDVGVDFAVPATPPSPRPNFFQCSVNPKGTRNFLHEPAMSAGECSLALEAGREQARLAARDGVDVLAVGEMGIGNSTSAAALCAALLPAPPESVAGRGTGLDEAALARKVGVIQRALELHAARLREADPLIWLAALGGFEIAALTGCLLEAARLRLPVLVDGFIASSAALVAQRIQPESLEGCFFAHQSAERGHQLLLESLKAAPLLHLDMRLGEATGAALAFPLLQAATRLISEMASFSEAGVSEAEVRAAS